MERPLTLRISAIGSITREIHSLVKGHVPLFGLLGQDSLPKHGHPHVNSGNGTETDKSPVERGGGHLVDAGVSVVHRSKGLSAGYSKGKKV